MPRREIVFFMYHELESPGRPLCQSDPGYVRYILSRESFRSQMEWLKRSGRRGLSISAALLYPTGDCVAITFDDGCASDLLTAAPILKEFGLNATFYITAGRIGHHGYLASDQLRELASMGFEIGCHSMTHAYLNGLKQLDLQREVVDAKKVLEDLIGRRVEHFSCPGGRYDDRTIVTVREAGYVSLATSHPRANNPATEPFLLGRVAMLQSYDGATFGAICKGENLWKLRLSEFARGGVRNLLGNGVYDRVRARLLGK